MLSLKRILTWCARHSPYGHIQKRRLSRRRAESLDVTTQGQLLCRRSNRRSGDTSVSIDTLVSDRHRGRAFSDPAISHSQHVYSYYPWSESEHEEILSRSPPPLRPHYETFPSLVEMGGFLSL
ncbi:hypothetical protein GGI25_002774 [Coemansia spiralis]|uniref:Uncharacterized protein n=2 Tax=Coemansia TaxID=4863 RepID=A0A9W8KYS5_9FUNG|nr:hypothetical protein EDC05_002107 [Coemansia umbellata]KAJ2625277.1 hypothetical protein GGI26_000747 [Coemansia sp. RSA 1358]KAJ2677984.1 hypothetical protein GGI25_002774 [Coemansia spiralis]